MAIDEIINNSLILYYLIFIYLFFWNFTYFMITYYFSIWNKTNKLIQNCWSIIQVVNLIIDFLSINMRFILIKCNNMLEYVHSIYLKTYVNSVGAQYPVFSFFLTASNNLFLNVFLCILYVLYTEPPLANLLSFLKGWNVKFIEESQEKQI